MRTPRSEDDILALLAEHFPVLHPDLLVGRGDDCAVLRPGGPLAVTCDVFVEDVHFRRRYFSAADIWDAKTVFYEFLMILGNGAGAIVYRVCEKLK